MIEPPSDRGRRLAALSQRLRVLHAELADQSGDMRAEQLRDEVQRAVATLPPQEREPFLAELMHQFPTWATAGGGPAPSAPARAANGAPEPRDPKSLAERLIEACRGMDPAEKAAIAARLSGAGLVVREAAPAAGSSSAPATPGQALTDLRKAVGMAADAAVDSTRVTELAALLSEFTLKLEPWACTYWRDISPEARNPVYQVLNKDIARFLSGDEKMNKEALARNAYKLRSLISLLMKGVVEAGKQFARDHLMRFSLEEIGKAAGQGSIMTSKDVLCWKQYARQMEGVDGPSIEKRLKSLMAKEVDEGLSRVAPSTTK